MHWSRLIRKGLFTVAVSLSVVACGLSIRHGVAAGEAMAPTISTGDHFASIGYKNNDVDPINRFDIVTYRREPDATRGIDESMIFVHRVVGMPGERVQIINGKVFVNDVELDESSFDKIEETRSYKAVTLPQDAYFLLGDNRGASEDSRYIGPVTRLRIDGKVSNIIRKADYDAGKR